jgi:hypothetical protein
MAHRAEGTGRQSSFAAISIYIPFDIGTLFSRLKLLAKLRRLLAGAIPRARKCK